jgi:hypothetical protein
MHVTLKKLSHKSKGDIEIKKYKYGEVLLIVIKISKFFKITFFL